tara:strand:- start:4890 stop:5309 length:420 start_codon:yes stop_codon:yes gene_type:complete
MRFINKMIADTISREQIQPLDMDKHDLSISDLGAGRLPLFAEDNNGNFNLSSEVFGYEMLRNIATLCKHYDMDIMRTIIIVQPVGILVNMRSWAYQELDEDGDIVYLEDKHIFKYDVGYSHEEQMIPNKIIIEQRVITQ